MTDPASIVSHELLARPPHERVRFLRELLAHTAAGIIVLDSTKAAAEAAYRLADAIVSRDAS